VTLPTDRSEFSDLRERAERDFPESWLPKEHGPTLVGRFKRLEEGHTAYGPCKIVVLETEAGTERSVWLLHRVLLLQFTRVRPRPGQLVAVHHQGRKTNASGTPYESYRVVVQRDASEPDWDALESEAGDSELDSGEEWVIQ
jgi:hypothetical protein